jgi:hypothetical protein
MTKIFAAVLGIAAGALGCYGQFEFAYGLEGHVNYVVCAAVLIGLMAAALPVFGEVSWQLRMYSKSICLWIGFLFCAVTLFFGAAERVGAAKSGPMAERSADRSAVTLAETSLGDAKAKLERAEADARAARKLPRTSTKKVQGCDAGCLSRYEVAVTNAKADVEKATTAVTSKQKVAKAETTWKQPDWLLPLTIDYGSFIACWFAGALFARQRKAEPEVKIEAPSTPVELPVSKRSVAAKKGWKSRRKRDTIRKALRVAGPQIRAVS